MSRTYRKDRFNETLNQRITRELSWYDRRICHSGLYRGVYRKTTKEEQEEYITRQINALRDEMYTEAKEIGYDTRPLLEFFRTGDVKALGYYKNSFYMRTEEIVRRYRFCHFAPSRKVVTVMISREEVIEEAKLDYFKQNRDGYFNETKRKKGFKHDCKKSVRTKNRRLCKKVLKGEYDDGKVYPSTYEDKARIWDWW